MLRLSFVLSWAALTGEADVADLIERLGDDRFAVRASAQTELARLLLSPQGHRYRPAVEAATHHPDLEVARRATAALLVFYDIRPTDYPVLPWIDMLPGRVGDRQAIIDRCLAVVRPPGSGWSGPDWPDYRQATAVYARELLRQGYPRHCVRRLLDEMVRQEQQYRDRHGMRELARE